MKYMDLSKTKKYSEELRPRSKSGVSWVVAVVVVGVAISGILLFARNSFNPLSIVANVASPDLLGDDGRTNVLILGSDERSVGDINSVLTDTILVASIGSVERNIVMISLPRDLWVEAEGPVGAVVKVSHQHKLNAIYAHDGIEEFMKVIEDVLGVPLHYYAVVDFNIFKDAIDILEGIDVDVERAFDDFSYPIEGKENASLSERYETVHFDAGLQTMDGETALKYVRSRKGTNGEGTDFARSKRQQNVIMAIKERLLSLDTLVNLPRVKELYDVYSDNVDTNLDFGSIQGFYLLSQQIDFDTMRSIVLDDRSAADEGGLLYTPDASLYGGAYVLMPKVGDFSQLRAYVQRYIFGDF